MADKVDSFATHNAVNGERDLLATTVFLNGTLTLATLLGIAFDPVCSLAVIPAFLQPHPRDGT